MGTLMTNMMQINMKIMYFYQNKISNKIIYKLSIYARYYHGNLISQHFFPHNKIERLPTT